ncbi:MAG: hypothetical protein ACTSRC_05375 [Candidatus Helarchaeota archaeon]
MSHQLNRAEISRLQRRIKSRLDYVIAFLLWGFGYFNFISVWIIGRIDSNYGGLAFALQVAPIYLFFPAFATFGMVSDRILASDILKNSDQSMVNERSSKINTNRLCNEDYIRIGLIIALVFVSLPWITARLGLFLEPYDSTLGAHVLFFQPVHVGENHGWIGVSMIISVILITKTERLYMQSIFKELSIYLLCFLMLWGVGLTLDDFLWEQFHLNFPFLVWGSGTGFIWGIIAQSIVIAGLSFPIYYLGWCKYYKLKLNYQNLSVD